VRVRTATVDVEVRLRAVAIDHRRRRRGARAEIAVTAEALDRVGDGRATRGLRAVRVLREAEVQRVASRLLLERRAVVETSAAERARRRDLGVRAGGAVLLADEAGRDRGAVSRAGRAVRRIALLGALLEAVAANNRDLLAARDHLGARRRRDRHATV